MKDWLLREIADGLQLLVGLALPGQPPSDTIKMTAVSWRKAFSARSQVWELEQDAPRIRAAFDALLPELESWPQPRQLFSVMPPRPAPPQLPPGQQTAEHRAVAHEWLPKIKRQINELNAKQKSRRIKPSASGLTEAEIQQKLTQINQLVSSNPEEFKHAKTKRKSKRKA